MYTQCPHCQTCFRIAEDHLKVANGKVRCGSCQEVFDATQHLFKNLTDREPITDFKTSTPATSRPVTTPAPAKPAENKPVPPPDYTPAPTPSPKAVEKFLQDRKQAPDQTRFMESLVGNDRYNNLDQMGPIDIPGNINFGDSIIQFAQENEPPQEEHVDEPPPAEHIEVTPPEAKTPDTNPYEDREDKELPASEADRASIQNFFTEVDSQLNEDETKSQLDKDIDELLAFAKGLDMDKELTKSNSTEELPKPETKRATPSRDENDIEEFDLRAIADFEKELEATASDDLTEQEPQGPESGFDDIILELDKGAESTKTEVNKTEQLQTEPDPEHDLENGEPDKPEKSLPPTDRHDDIVTDDSIEIEGHRQLNSVFADEAIASDEDIPRALRRSLEILDQSPKRSLGQTLLMLLVILILIGGLGFQYVLFRNVELANRFPELIPTLSKVCKDIPCRYSGKIDVSQIKLLSRDISSDPNQANALLISASFVNQAPFDQPYPILEITLYDLAGNVVASRRFTPKEYLEKMYNRFLLMESGTPVHITLAVLDPGKDAVNFEFSFHPDR